MFRSDLPNDVKLKIIESLKPSEDEIIIKRLKGDYCPHNRGWSMVGFTGDRPTFVCEICPEIKIF